MLERMIILFDKQVKQNRKKNRLETKRRYKDEARIEDLEKKKWIKTSHKKSKIF